MPPAAVVVEVFDWAELHFALADLWAPSGLEMSSSGTGIIDWEWLCGASPVLDAVAYRGEVPDEALMSCRAAGRVLSHRVVGYRVVSVLRARSLRLDCVTEQDLYAIWGWESRGLDAWSEIGVFAAELGSTTEFPVGEVALFGLGEEADGYDAFVELGLEGLAEERVSPAATRPDYEVSSTAAQVIAAVSATPGAIGIASSADVLEGADIEVVEVDWGAGCVDPTIRSVADGTYALSEPVQLLWTDSFRWPGAIELLEEKAHEFAETAGLLPPR